MLQAACGTLHAARCTTWQAAAVSVFPRIEYVLLSSTPPKLRAAAVTQCRTPTTAAARGVEAALRLRSRMAAVSGSFGSAPL
jgi:hypothetical protein